MTTLDDRPSRRELDAEAWERGEHPCQVSGHTAPNDPQLSDCERCGTDVTIPDEERCSCAPCTQPAFGVPGRDHCAACCYGSLIVEYDLACPVAEHREMAKRQWGITEVVVDG